VNNKKETKINLSGDEELQRQYMPSHGNNNKTKAPFAMVMVG
jgi:hypothetical protein